MKGAATRPEQETPDARWRGRLHEVIYEAETPAGRAFDVALIWLILLSVAAVMLESVRSVRAEYGALLYTVEWVFTVLFTVEYLLRLVSVRRPLAYRSEERRVGKECR